MARVLIAEDDADISTIVSHLLGEEGHDVSVLADGDSVVERLSWAPTDLLILDIMMPGLDGYEILEKMRDGSVPGDTRVLVLTARNRESDWKRSYELGATFHMTKPFDPEELVATVRKVLEMTDDELADLREHEAGRASLLSQIEQVFGE